VIYFLEDDDSIRELVIYTLRNTGMEAMGFPRPSAFWEAMQQEELPALVLLDIMLPEEDGVSVLKKLRANRATKTLPVIMLTAKGTEYDQVIGLDYGADDYIPKPFGMMALIARIKAVLRRSAPSEEEQEYVLGDLYVNPTRHIVRVGKEPISLTLKEFELLCLLLEHQGVVFTRDRLLNHIWGYAFDGESRTVDVHVRHLRQKLGECGKYIETVRGIGYRAGDGES
jgi:two-component system alkaline phosphatase synthesis response regulator PhoP